MTPLRATLELALEHHRSGRLPQAEALYREILRRHPGQPDALNLLGLLAHNAGQSELAIELIGQAVARLPGEADFHGNLAAAYEFAGRIADAIRHYREALRLNPASVHNMLHLCDALQQHGELDEALELCQSALRLQPDSALGHCLLGELAGCGRYALSAADIGRMQQLIVANRQSAQDASLLYFTLAAHWERQGDYDQSFACYRRANELKQQVYREANQAFDRARHRALIDDLIAVFTPRLVEQLRPLGVDSEAPIFVVGMARSGTSLVEQILASHPQVHGAGERKDIDELAMALHGPLKTTVKYPACMPLLDGETARNLANGYLQRLAQNAGDACRIVDKMQQNYLHLGLIAALFPRARIIHCLRDPMDVCASAYFQNFKWLPSAASLEDIAFCYREYARLMEHWQLVLRVPIHEVVYEELIADQEGVSRKLVAACGLAWDEQCLDFHRTKRDVRTASKLQVRQPIYRRSMGRWKAFQSHLEPLRQALGNSRPVCHVSEKNVSPLEHCHA